MNLRQKPLNFSPISHLLHLFVFIFVFFLSCTVSAKIINSNNQIQSQSRSLSPFQQVVVDGDFHVIINHSDQQRISISTSSNIQPYIQTQVRNQRLYIHYRKYTAIQNEQTPNISINLPTLSGAQLNGNATLDATGINGTQFTGIVNGKGQMALSGFIDRATLRTHGNGQIDAKNLRANNAVITIDGNGNIAATAKDSMKVKINGSGSVTYYGNPAFFQPQINGNGSVKRGN